MRFLNESQLLSPLYSRVYFSRSSTTLAQKQKNGIWAFPPWPFLNTQTIHGVCANIVKSCLCVCARCVHCALLLPSRAAASFEALLAHRGECECVLTCSTLLRFSSASPSPIGRKPYSIDLFQPLAYIYMYIQPMVNNSVEVCAPVPSSGTPLVFPFKNYTRKTITRRQLRTPRAVGSRRTHLHPPLAMASRSVAGAVRPACRPASTAPDPPSAPAKQTPPTASVPLAQQMSL